MTEAGLTYFKHASNDRPQGFLPKDSIFEVKAVKQPANAQSLLMKVRGLAKREAEKNLMRNMFEIVVSMDASTQAQADAPGVVGVTAV